MYRLQIFISPRGGSVRKQYHSDRDVVGSETRPMTWQLPRPWSRRMVKTIKAPQVWIN